MGGPIFHGEFTQFHQPSATSAILNRVVGNQLSEIHGHIKSNGLVYLINQNGILIGPNGRIKTGGFLASTLNIANGEFLEAGEMRFSGDSDAGLTLKGELWGPKGNIFLISKTIEHSGNILAPEGEVYALAGTEIIKVTGEISASHGDAGGMVHILGEYVQLLDEAKVDVSGELEGGLALIGGGYKGLNPEIPTSRAVYVGENVHVNADAISTGDGRKVIFWGDELNWFFWECHSLWR